MGGRAVQNVFYSSRTFFFLFLPKLKRIEGIGAVSGFFVEGKK